MRVAEWRASGETVVFTNGCFDLLHVGHIALLEDCRRYGSKLVLGLNSDASVCRLKGPTRPIVGEQERARVMAALAVVDAVVLFDQDTPIELIRALKPDVLVKGGDYTIETVVGHEDVIANGGRFRSFRLSKASRRRTLCGNYRADQLNGRGDSELIIVTGGAGFIGSNLVHELNRIGERDILVVDNLAPAPNLSGPKFLNLWGAEYSDYMDKMEFRRALAPASSTMRRCGRFCTRARARTRSKMTGVT